MNCSNCGITLQSEFGLHPLRRRDDWTVQYRDALGITFIGGFGMFFDDMTVGKENPKDRTAILCMICAQRLIDNNPWIAKYIM